MPLPQRSGMYGDHEPDLPGITHTMKIKRILSLISLVGMTGGAILEAETGSSQSSDPESRLVFLSNESVEIGIFPELAGSVMVFRKPGGENFLYVHPEDWLDWEPTIPDPHQLGTWTDFFGHIMWLGPQSDFWNQQDVLPEMQGQWWPPDPYLVYGNYRILEQTEDSLSLEGPESPYTGVKLTKTYHLNGEKVEIEVVATNSGERNLKWDLWSNTRVPPKWPFLVPVAGLESARIDPAKLNVIEWSADAGFFSFDLTPSAKGESESAKAFVSASQPWIAAFSEDTVFVKAFEMVDPSAISPGQSLVEVYYSKNTDIDKAFVELEAHGPYTLLKPGKSTTFHETWSLLPFDGENTRESRIAWAKKNLE